MADLLGLLRDYNVNKKEIIERDNKFIFGEFSWPKNAKTNYLIKYAKGIKIIDYYTLECLVYFLKNIQLIHPVYVKQAEAENIPAVRHPDRTDLIKYLKGETTTCKSIDKNALLVKPTKVKRTHVGEDTKLLAKKSRMSEAHAHVKVEKTTLHLIASKEESVTNEPRVKEEETTCPDITPKKKSDAHLQKVKEEEITPHQDKPKKEEPVTTDVQKVKKERITQDFIPKEESAIDVQNVKKEGGTSQQVICKKELFTEDVQRDKNELTNLIIPKEEPITVDNNK